MFKNKAEKESEGKGSSGFKPKIQILKKNQQLMSIILLLNLKKIIKKKQICVIN